MIRSFLSKPKLNQRAINLLGDASLEFYLFAASSWEIVSKAQSGKLVLPDPPAEFLTRAIRVMTLRSVPMTQQHALAVGDLPH